MIWDFQLWRDDTVFGDQFSHLLPGNITYLASPAQCPAPKKNHHVSKFIRIGNINAKIIKNSSNQAPTQGGPLLHDPLFLLDFGH